MSKIPVNFISSDNKVISKDINKLEINVQNQDLWVSFEKGSIGSYEQCFFRILDLNNKEHYFVLKNVFLRYFNDAIEISYKDQLKMYYQLESSDQILELTKLYKEQKKKIKKAQAASELGVSLQEQVELQQLEEENNKLKLLIDFGLVEQNKGENLWK